MAAPHPCLSGDCIVSERHETNKYLFAPPTESRDHPPPPRSSKLQSPHRPDRRAAGQARSPARQGFMLIPAPSQPKPKPNPRPQPQLNIRVHVLPASGKYLFHIHYRHYPKEGWEQQAASARGTAQEGKQQRQRKLRARCPARGPAVEERAIRRGAVGGCEG